MSSLSDYVKGLDDAVWTDARASELSEIPTTTTWTNARLGNLDLLAGGTGAKPVEHWQYSGSQSSSLTTFAVSITDYLSCLVFGTFTSTKADTVCVTYKTASNTSVSFNKQQRVANLSTFYYSFTISRFG